MLPASLTSEALLLGLGRFLGREGGLSKTRDWSPRARRSNSELRCTIVDDTGLEPRE